MEKSLEKSIMDILQVDLSSEVRDPALEETSQIVYNCEHTFTIRIQEKPETAQVLKEP